MCVLIRIFSIFCVVGLIVVFWFCVKLIGICLLVFWKRLLFMRLFMLFKIGMILGVGFIFKIGVVLCFFI